MLFNSFVFLVFLAVILPIHRLLPKKYRNLFLLGCSYVFYGYWDWRFLSLILISTLLDFYVGRAVYHSDDPRRRKHLLMVSVIGNLGLLGVFKYYNFFIDSFVDLASVFGVHMDFAHLNVLLPVGISFYTFQTMSYTLDIYRGKLTPTDSFENFALFVAFFPQLVAGPIERAVHLLPQIERKPDPTVDDMREGFALVTMGMFKKVMIGDTCGRIVDQIFADPSLYSSGELLMGAMLFCIQIYADFSGYSNIARGTARFFGIHIMVNFEQPYLSANITEFWRRWHISLSSWLRDYLYISIGGNRKGKVRTYVNLMITMLLGGLWHGAMYSYVFWGFLQGFLLSIHKIMLKGKKVSFGFTYNGVRSLAVFILKVAGTHVLILISFLFFRAQSLTTGWYILKKWAFWEPGEYASQVFTIVLTYYVVAYAIDIIEYATKDHTFVLKLKPAYRYGLYLAIWMVTLVYMFQVQPMPFIYFQF